MLDILIVKDKMHHLIKETILFRLLHRGEIFINEKSLKEERETLGFIKQGSY